MSWNTSYDFRSVFLVNLFGKNNIYIQKSTHISRNIPRLQNAIHNICRVRDSERNKKTFFSFKFVRFISGSIRKKEVLSRSKLSEEV